MKTFTGNQGFQTVTMLRNNLAYRRWRERWFLQMGTRLFHAKDMADLRSEEDRKRYEALELRRLSLEKVDS